MFNDEDPTAFDELKKNCAPLLGAIKEEDPHLHLSVVYYNKPFEVVLPELFQEIDNRKHQNVLFNLDPYGHSDVQIETIREILSFRISSEVFLTFPIEAFLAFLSPHKKINSPHLNQFDVGQATGELLDEELISKQEWLGVTEKRVYSAFEMCTPYFSPFSINNRKGWRYWLLHFANVYRARQVYNDILHKNGGLQAHFGRSGLKMLAYDPAHEGTLYLFGESDRERARKELYDDIPRFISEVGDVLSVNEFYAAAYNSTAAHSQDIHSMIIANPDLEVITPAGGERRKANTISINDTIKLKSQRTMFPLFSNPLKKKE